MQKGMQANFSQLKKDGFKGKQRIAVALSLAGLSNKRKKKAKKKR